MKKRIICLSAILTFVCSTQVFAYEFKDINNSDAKEKIEYFNDEGYFDVFLNENTEMFYPERIVSRGEFAVLFQQLLELENNTKNKQLPFVDTKALTGDVLKSVQSLYNNGIISGKVVDGKLYFGYDDKISREEMLTIIGRYLNLTSNDEIAFKDANKVSPWARQYVSYFYNNKIVELNDNGEFNPKGDVTREEVVETLYAVGEYINTKSDNGLVVKNYIGNNSIGYKNDTYKNSTFTMISDIDLTKDNDILIADSQSNQLRIAKDDRVSTLVGTTSVYDFSGLPIGGYVDGDVATAILNKPNKSLVYDENIIIFTQEGSNTIRGYNTKNKNVYTIVGKVESGYKNGSNTEALFSNPTGLAKDSKGNIYVADTLNNVIRKIDSNYNVTLYAGSPNDYGNVLGNVSNAKFNEPTDLFMVDDVLYICDSGNNMIKKIVDDKVVVVGGVDTYINEDTQTQVGGDRDGSVAVAKFNYPTGIFVLDDVVYVADSENNKIKTIKNGIVTTIAGSGEYGNQLGNALQANFDYPSAVLVKGSSIYVADKYNHSIKVIEKKSN